MNTNACFNCGVVDARFTCSVCRTAKYCSQECQKTHWKIHKNENCQTPAQKMCTQWLNVNSSSSSSAKHASEDAKKNVKRSSSLNNPDNGVAAEAYRQLRFSMKVEWDYYCDVYKNYLRDRLTSLQNDAHACLMRGEFAKVDECSVKICTELKSQYDSVTNVAPNDTVASLQFKVIIADMIYGLNIKSSSTNFAAENSKTTHKKKLLTVVQAMISKCLNMKAMCDRFETVYYPEHTTDVDDILSESQSAAIFDLAEPYKAVPVGKQAYKGPVPPYFPGPPSWVCDEMFQDKMRAMLPGHTYDLMTTNMFTQRKIDKSHRFYSTHYKSLHAYNLNEEMPFLPSEAAKMRATESNINKVTTSGSTAEISFQQHMSIHLNAGCKVDMNNINVCQDPQEHMTASEFKSRITVQFPHIIVGECDYCGEPAVGECICGEVYCSKACLAADWTNHRSMCNTVIDNNVFLLVFTPLCWGQKSIQQEEYWSW